MLVEHSKNSLIYLLIVLGETLYSHVASLFSGVQMGTSKQNAEVNPAMD